MKFATPINRAIVYNPQTGKNLSEKGEYVQFDQHFIRREKEGVVKITDNRSSQTVKTKNSKKEDNK